MPPARVSSARRRISNWTYPPSTAFADDSPVATLTSRPEATPDRGIGKSSGQVANGGRMKPDRRVGIDDDFAANHLARRVLERRFSAPHGDAKQLDAPIGVSPNDRVRLVG